jgi:hypothetical protein
VQAVTAASASQLAAQPANLWSLLHADHEQLLTDVREQLAKPAAKVVLVHLAVRRRGGGDLTEFQLDYLAQSLRHASEDARAVERAVANGRLRPPHRR